MLVRQLRLTASFVTPRPRAVTVILTSQLVVLRTDGALLYDYYFLGCKRYPLARGVATRETVRDESEVGREALRDGLAGLCET